MALEVPFRPGTGGLETTLHPRSKTLHTCTRGREILMLSSPLQQHLAVLPQSHLP